MHQRIKTKLFFSKNFLFLNSYVILSRKYFVLFFFNAIRL